MTIDVALDHYSHIWSLKHSEVHAYYGHLSVLPTYVFLLSKHGRPFIISRSNSVGTGAYASHWTGDNVANW
jgi:alpha-glucosidase (family GH31 glycosyl hydrolase)